MVFKRVKYSSIGYIQCWPHTPQELKRQNLKNKMKKNSGDCLPCLFVSLHPNNLFFFSIHFSIKRSFEEISKAQHLFSLFLLFSQHFPLSLLILILIYPNATVGSSWCANWRTSCNKCLLSQLLHAVSRFTRMRSQLGLHNKDRRLPWTFCSSVGLSTFHCFIILLAIFFHFSRLKS